MHLATHSLTHPLTHTLFLSFINYLMLSRPVEIIVHPNYDATTHLNDVALLIFAKNLYNESDPVNIVHSAALSHMQSKDTNIPTVYSLILTQSSFNQSQLLFLSLSKLSLSSSLSLSSFSLSLLLSLLRFKILRICCELGYK